MKSNGPKRAKVRSVKGYGRGGGGGGGGGGVGGGGGGGGGGGAIDNKGEKKVLKACQQKKKNKNLHLVPCSVESKENTWQGENSKKGLLGEKSGGTKNKKKNEVLKNPGSWGAWTARIRRSLLNRGRETTHVNQHGVHSEWEKKNDKRMHTSMQDNRSLIQKRKERWEGRRNHAGGGGKRGKRKKGKVT